MRKVLFGVLGFSLACGGGGGAPTFEGRWCENDPEVGCYRFEGDTVIEEPVNNRRGYSGESRGPWKLEGSLLIMSFPSGNWTLEVVDHSDSVLILKDHSQNDTFTFTRSPSP